MDQWYLLYDDSCPVCLASVENMWRLDRLGRILLVPLSDMSAVAHLTLPESRQLRELVHLVSDSGKVYSGIDAIGQMGLLLPRSRLLAWLLLLPPIRAVGRLAYGFIAKHRHRISEQLHFKRL